MPESKQSGRSIRGTLTKTGSYAGTTTPQLHGKSSNKTAQFIAGIDPNDPGHQAFYREALTLPHPLNPQQQVNYGQYQELLNGPHRADAIEAYRTSNRLDKASTAEQMQQAVFDQARAQLLQRGAAKPDEYAFPESATEALRAPTRARQIRAGNFVTGERPTQVTNAAMQAQRFANLPTGDEVMAAPGMPVRLLRGVGAGPAPARTILGTIATR